jgi:hypothetical protein
LGFERRVFDVVRRLLFAVTGNGELRDRGVKRLGPPELVYQDIGSAGMCSNPAFEIMLSSGAVLKH